MGEELIEVSSAVEEREGLSATNELASETNLAGT